MDIKGNVLSQLVNKMTWNIARSQRLTTNISNFDVPNYQARDIRPFEESIQGATAKQQSVLHVAEVVGGREFSRETQTLDLTENAANYQANLNIFKKYLGLMKTVLGKMG